jgi:hypothetical protein
MPIVHDRLKDSVSRNLIALTIATGLFIGGCVPTTTVDWEPEEPVDPNSSRNTWDSPAGRMGVISIMPPSEDVRVGDMYVFPFNPDISSSTLTRKQAVLSISPRWGTLNLLQELEQEYQLRPAWPKTPDAYIQNVENANEREWPEAIEPQNESIFARDSVTNRLRNIGVPEFSTYTLTEGDADALVPTEAINLVLGTAWNDDKILTIRLNSGETYSLGLQKVIGVAIEDTDQGSALKSPYRDNLALLADPQSDSVWLRILSDVIYVRSIDIIIQSQSAFEPDEEASADEFVSEAEETVEIVEAAEPEEGDSEEGADADSEEAMADEEDEAKGEFIKTVTEEILDHALDPAYAAFVRANAINELLIKSGSDDLPGGFLRFVSITDESVTIRRVWQRGLAVGVRGLTLEVDKFTGDVIRSGNMGTLRP